MSTHVNYSILIVDDMPQNLSVLHDVLEEVGFQVCTAEHGETALEYAQKVLPDLILLDADMPHMDGFAVCRALKDDVRTEHIPVILVVNAEAEHVVTAFAVGAVDCISKPARPMEVVARINAHLHRSRISNQARTALDAYGQATIAINPQTGYLAWQTPLARKLIQTFFAQHTVPESVLSWLRELLAGGGELTWSTVQQEKRLSISLFGRTSEEECLLVLREESNIAPIELLIEYCGLTHREAEVLYWVAQGKTSRDIGEILDSSPRTVNKHLERVYQKMGVETRTAAATKALDTLAKRGK